MTMLRKEDEVVIVLEVGQEVITEEYLIEIEVLKINITTKQPIKKNEEKRFEKKNQKCELLECVYNSNECSMKVDCNFIYANNESIYN